MPELVRPCCPHCGSAGPFEHVLVATTAIEVEFSCRPDGRLAWAIPEEAESRELDAYPEDFFCSSCDGRVSEYQLRSSVGAS